MDTIFEKIIKKGEEAAREITKETETLVANLIKEEKAKAFSTQQETIKKEKLKLEREIAQKEASFVLEKRQIILKHKMSLIDDVIKKLYQKLNNLENEELLEFASNLIKAEKLVNKQVMEVNKDDYKRYLTAFSSHKKTDLVLLDKLNKKLDNKVEISLSNEPATIKDGFLIIGKDYDLNFSVSAYLANLKAQHEKEIFEILFKE
ncbi:MAG: hypothetical protein RBS76_00190 [Acholeplasmatales bacterium]|jgi:vacuolar-type H+-ATPase subunit E/Vma4|nr:hypothetical protein [Acholeplasmataceae bacterium]MDY0114900.1 hypothetical protein [Acholeplasmatales bacterium]MCK9234218.1 hypothetical protein [Acholeplasmataceae bacterium]MCK9289255.1 hypothetical protein [Acholeplasmataceae bacterium]MCK9427159.1 hypothetical protein [Acholeplasmataceae bacterium]